MAQDQLKTIKMIYRDQLKHLFCPKNANYEECIDIAAEIFFIPPIFRKFIALSDEKGDVFEKHTFEYYNTLFPSPEQEFYIKIDMTKFKSQSSETTRKPLGELKVKRKRRADIPKIDKNSFLESLCVYEIERPNSEEPEAKRQKSSVVTKKKSSWWHLLRNKIFN